MMGLTAGEEQTDRQGQAAPRAEQSPIGVGAGHHHFFQVVQGLGQG